MNMQSIHLKRFPQEGELSPLLSTKFSHFHLRSIFLLFLNLTDCSQICDFSIQKFVLKCNHEALQCLQLEHIHFTYQELNPAYRLLIKSYSYLQIWMWMGPSSNLALWLMMRQRGRKRSDGSYFRMFVMMIMANFSKVIKIKLISCVSICGRTIACVCTKTQWVCICGFF